MFEVEAYYFDFDDTLTNRHVEDFGTRNPSDKECAGLMKQGAIDTLRQIMKRGHHVAIITNGTKDRIPIVLKGAGLRDEEIAKIDIHAAGNPKIIVCGYKPNAIKELAFGKWNDTKNHYFYDDRDIFYDEAKALIPDFNLTGKNLVVEQVNPRDYSFLDKIRERITGMKRPISEGNEFTKFNSADNDTTPLVTKTEENDCCISVCALL